MSLARDAIEQCAAVVRDRDRDRYIADLYVPEPARGHIFALHAFNAEISRIREAVSEPGLGELRLQWWREALDGNTGGNPVATALNATIAAFHLPIEAFHRLIEARTFDLYDSPIATLNSLEGYAGDTASALFQLAAIVLADGRDPGAADASGHAGVAYALAGILRALPRHAAAGKSFLPADRVAAHGLALADYYAGRATAPLGSLLAELRQIARDHLAKARSLIAGLDPAVAVAFLPIALVEPHLDRMERQGYNPFRDSAELAPWRRQWVLWRAVRRGVP